MNRWNSWLQNGTGSQHVAAILFTKQRLLCSVGFVRVGMKNAHTLDKPIQRTHWTNVLFLYTSLASGRAGKRAHGYHKHSIVMLMKTCENLWHLRTRWAGHSQSRTSEHQKRMDQQQKKPISGACGVSQISWRTKVLWADLKMKAMHFQGFLC